MIVASRNTMKAHDDGCEWADEIPDVHREEYRDIREAIDEGFEPAKCCLQFSARDRMDGRW